MKLMLITLKATGSKTTESALYTHMQILCKMCNPGVLRLGKTKILLGTPPRHYNTGNSTQTTASPYTWHDTTLGPDTARL